jgi:hypothetical protein
VVCLTTLSVAQTEKRRMIRLINNELERIWKEAVGVPRQLPTGTEEGHENLKLGQPVCGPIFEPVTCQFGNTSGVRAGRSEIVMLNL